MPKPTGPASLDVQILRCCMQDRPLHPGNLLCAATIHLYMWRDGRSGSTCKVQTWAYLHDALAYCT